MRRIRTKLKNKKHTIIVIITVDETASTLPKSKNITAIDFLCIINSKIERSDIVIAKCVGSGAKLKTPLPDLTIASVRSADTTSPCVKYGSNNCTTAINSQISEATSTVVLNVFGCAFKKCNVFW